MKRKWVDRSMYDEQIFEVEVRQDVWLGIHRLDPTQPWQAMLYDSGAEEAPFVVFKIKARTVAGAKREAVRKTANHMFKIVEALENLKAVA